MPRVSVLMPVYNAGRYVARAVESILHQTFRDFELLIIDDGSTDGSLAVLNRYAGRDERIQLFTRANTGYCRALNDALAFARGSLIARMDADDVSLPTRFAEQVRFLDGHPETAVVGTAIEMIDSEGVSICVHRHPRLHIEIDGCHIEARGVALAHPTVMIRAAALREAGGYRCAFEPAEDYDLWLRLAERSQLANLSDPLLRYRLHPKSQSTMRRIEQRDKACRALGEARVRRGLRAGVGPQTLPEPPVHPRQQWARMAHDSGNYAGARRLAVKAVRSSPASIGSWRVLAVAMLGPHARTINGAMRGWLAT